MARAHGSKVGDIIKMSFNVSRDVRCFLVIQSSP